MATSITNSAQLKLTAVELHDARFTSGALVFDPATQTFTLKCWVLEPMAAAMGSSRRWRAYHLSFSKVADCRVHVKEKVLYYELATLKFSEVESKLDLVTHYGLEISLTVSELDGALTETNETLNEWK